MSAPPDSGSGRPLRPSPTHLPDQIPRTKRGSLATTERAATALTPSDGRSNGGRQPRREQSRYDQDLGNAKNNRTMVRFYLAVETEFTDEDFTVEGTVEQIDKYDIQIKFVSDGLARTVWIKKSVIVGTEVLR